MPVVHVFCSSALLFQDDLSRCPNPGALSLDCMTCAVLFHVHMNSIFILSFISYIEPSACYGQVTVAGTYTTIFLL